MEKPSYVFISPSEGEIGMEEMVKIISAFVSEQPSLFYRVVIGSDSQEKRANGNSEVDFVTAVIVHRIGKGARYFWRKEKQKRTIVLREKIYTETLMSLNLAEVLVPLLRKIVSPAKYDLEIHIDVGSLGPTREMIREVVGMVVGSGYVAKTKPDSWGASKVADKHT